MSSVRFVRPKMSLTLVTPEGRLSERPVPKAAL